MAFVEVKTRSQDRAYNDPLDAVTEEKQKRLERLASIFIRRERPRLRRRRVQDYEYLHVGVSASKTLGGLLRVLRVSYADPYD